MSYKLLLLCFGMLLLSCNKSEDVLTGFVQVGSSYDIVDFIEEVESGDEDILINTEVVEVIASDNLVANAFSRIITVKNEDTIHGLSFNLNLDTQGNTIDIASMQYEFIEDDELVSYSYSMGQNNENNPQLLNYSIEESTANRFKATISGVLSSYVIIDNSYTTLMLSDIDLDIAF